MQVREPSDCEEDTREAPSDREEKTDLDEKTREAPSNPEKGAHKALPDHEEETREAPLDPGQETRELPSDRKEKTREALPDPEEEILEAPSHPDEETHEEPLDPEETQRSPPNPEGETREAPSNPGVEIIHVAGLAVGSTDLEGPVVLAHRKLTIGGNLPPNKALAHVESTGARRRGRSSAAQFYADERGRRRKECVDVRRRGRDKFADEGEDIVADREGHVT